MLFLGRRVDISPVFLFSEMLGYFYLNYEAMIAGKSTKVKFTSAVASERLTSLPEGLSAHSLPFECPRSRQN